MLKRLVMTLIAYVALVGPTQLVFGADAEAPVINNENKNVQHDPTLVVERAQMIQSLVMDLQKPNPPADTFTKLNRYLVSLQGEVRDLANQLTQCRATKK